MERVNRLLNVQDYHDGEDIVTEGTRGDKFFMMVQGEAFAFRQVRAPESAARTGARAQIRIRFDSAWGAR